MRIVQWNTHHGGKRTDGILDVQGITNWLVNFTPDIISLNELEQIDGYGNTDQLEHHRSALQAATGVPWYATFCTLLGGGANKGIGVAILSKWSHSSIIRKDCGGRPGLSVLLADLDLRVTTTHPDPDSAQRRNINLTNLLLTLPAGGRHLICGDFNATPTSVEIAPWPTLFKDAWAEARKLGKATSFTTDGITHGSHRIDYIWERGVPILSCDVPNTARVGGVFPSDHHPVIATF